MQDIWAVGGRVDKGVIGPLDGGSRDSFKKEVKVGQGL